MARAKKTTKVGSSGSREAPDDVFDIPRIRQLIELMQEYDLSEVDLRQEDKRIRLQRGPNSLNPAYLAPPTASSPPPAASAFPPTPSATVSPRTEVDDKNIHLIKSPMVGTFYAKPKPDAEPYVKIGDHVSPDSIICIIEAMKMFNEIAAECTGQVVAVLVDNEQPVDVDKPLFKVDTSK